MAKKELFVAKSDELPDGERKIVPNGNSEIGVYRVKGELFNQNLRARWQQQQRKKRNATFRSEHLGVIPVPTETIPPN